MQSKLSKDRDGFRLFKSIDPASITCFIFDLDHTLLEYEDTYRSLILGKCQEALKTCGLGFTYDMGKYEAIPLGATIDLQNGFILILDSNKQVTGIFTDEMISDTQEIVKLGYGLTINFKTGRYKTLDNWYWLDEAAIYHHLAQTGAVSPSIEQFWRVNRIICDAHKDGSIKDELVNHPEKYIKPTQPETFDCLEIMIDSGKMISIITNTEPNYLDRLLKYCSDGSRSLRGYFPDKSISACNGNKPEIFNPGRFNEVAEQWGIKENSSIVNVGDDLYADVIAPGKLGIHAFHKDSKYGDLDSCDILVTNTGTKTLTMARLEKYSTGLVSSVGKLVYLID